MSTPADEDNPYHAPAAELREELPPRGWRHVFIGMGSGIMGTAMTWKQFGWMDSSRVAVSVLSVLVAGVVLSRFRQLRPVAAIVLGFSLSFMAAIAIVIVAANLGLL